MSQPIIGITLDYEESGTYAPFPYYILRENYCGAVSRAGGIPLLLPHETGSVDAYAGLIDGLIITGGNFDIDPSHYGVNLRHETVITKDNRTRFELAIARNALESQIPILGICGGQQLLNVMLGGSLIQHIPDTVQNALAHEQKNPKNEPGHMVSVIENTLLHRITGQRELAVNSSHHQAVERIAPEMIVNAIAPDGVIEGIEHITHPFCLGLQWHPEYAINASDRAVFSSFIKAAAR